MLKEQDNSIKAFKNGFQLPKVKSPQKKEEEKEKEMKYTLAFHAEGKNTLPYFRPLLFDIKWQTNGFWDEERRLNLNSFVLQKELTYI